MTEHRLDRIEEAVGELWGREARGKDLAALRRRYGNDALGLIEHEFGDPIPLFSKQREIAASVRDHPFTLVIGANGTGKDHVGARLAVAYATLGWLVLATAPVEKQVKHFMREAFRVWEQAHLPGWFGDLGWQISRGEHGRILAFTSTDTSRVSGYHSPTGVLILTTEGQGLLPAIWEGLVRCLTGASSRFVVIGNPTSPEGKFYEAARAPHWHLVRIAAADHPNIQQGREVIPGGITPQFIETIANEYGVGSGQYRSAVLAEFPEDAIEALCRRAWLERAQQRWRGAPPFNPHAETILGLDIARLGGDACALAVRQGIVLYEVVTWRGLDTTETLERVFDELRRLGVDPAHRAAPPRWDPRPLAPLTIVCDEVGVGAGPFDQLRRAAAADVIGFNGGRRPSREGEGKFVNTKSESYWHLRRLLEADGIALPADPKLADELCGMRYKTEPTSGKIALEAKDEVRARLGRSPDRGDAVMMAFTESIWRGPPVGGFSVTL